MAGTLNGQTVFQRAERDLQDTRAERQAVAECVSRRRFLAQVRAHRAAELRAEATKLKAKIAALSEPIQEDKEYCGGCGYEITHGNCACYAGPAGTSRWTPGYSLER